MPDASDRYAGVWSPDTLVERAARVTAGAASRTAYIDASERLTFAEASERSGRLAGLLAGQIEPGRVVSWWLPNGVSAAVVHHAILRAGCVPNPIPIGLRAHELRAILTEAAPAALITAGTVRGFDHEGAARALTDAWVLGPAEVDAALADRQDPPARPSSPADDALLLYTSGSTGRPKGVRHTHRSLLAEIDSLVPVHGLTPEDRYLGGAPVGHIAGLVYGVLMPLALGTSTVFVERWNGGAAAEAARAEHATFQTGPPAFLLSLAEAGGQIPTFRLFSTGGATIPPGAIRDAGARVGCLVKRAYGSTEMPTLSATTLDDPEDERLLTDGRPIGSAEMRIVDAAGADVAPGADGEIWARGPELFAGYRDAALDAAAFDTDGWYRTGDIGRVGADGCLRVTGRRSDVIIRGGENISAAELEALMEEHPAVTDAAAVGFPDPRLGERVCAFVALRDGASMSLADLVAWLRDRGIATFKLPERLEVRDALPKTDAGKVRKGELRAQL